MKSGDTICIGGKIRNYLDDGKSWVEYKTGRDQTAVVLFLGLKGRKEDFDKSHWLAVLNTHGLISTDQLTEEEWKVIKARIEAKLAKPNGDGR